MNTVERTRLWRKKSVSSPLGLLQPKTKTHYCRHLGVGSIHLKEQIKHQYNTWLGFITRHNWKPHWKLTLCYGYLCSWTCIYMFRQLFSHVEFCGWGIYFFYLKHTHTHTLCFYCIITLPIIPSRSFPSCTAHTLHYCWHKNHLSKYLYLSPTTRLIFPKHWSLFQLGQVDNSSTFPGDTWMLWVEE